MKNLLFIIILFPFVASCQVPETKRPILVKYMVEEGFLSEIEAKELSGDSLYTTLYDVYLKRYRLKRGETRRMYFSSSELESKTSKLIDRIYELDLIDEPTFNDIKLKHGNRNKKRRLASEIISDELMLFQYLFELEQSKGKIELAKSYLQELQTLGLISSEEKFDTDFSSKEEIIKLLDRKLIIHIDSLPESIPDCYRLAYYSLEKLDPNLKISNYSFAIEDVQHDDLKYQSAVVRFSNLGIEYKANNSYDKNYKESEVYEKFDRRFFFRIFNKVLTDQKSEYRIMDIEMADKSSTCLILITKEQYDFLKEPDDRSDFTYFDPDWFKIEVSKYWNPFNLLSQQETERYFNLYDSIGLFNHLSESQRLMELQKLKQTYLHSGESILYEMANICLGFDWEMFDGNKPYKVAILDFASITHGDFSPERIRDDFSFSKETVDIAFDFKGKTYKKTIEVTGDWYSGEFLELINKAISENNLSGKFYDLPDGGQVSGHIYLTKEQYEFLLSNNLLDFYKEEN